MSTATLSFKPPPPTDGFGPVSEGCKIPVMRPLKSRQGMSNRSILKMLDDALEMLSESSCCFWACEGPTRPQNMCTCSKCWAMREVAKAKATLQLRDDLGM